MMLILSFEWYIRLFLINTKLCKRRYLSQVAIQSLTTPLCSLCSFCYKMKVWWTSFFRKTLTLLQLFFSSLVSSLVIVFCCFIHFCLLHLTFSFETHSLGRRKYNDIQHGNRWCCGYFYCLWLDRCFVPYLLFSLFLFLSITFETMNTMNCNPDFSFSFTDISDGCGRTGTYCLIDMVLNRMSKGMSTLLFFTLCVSSMSITCLVTFLLICFDSRH